METKRLIQSWFAVWEKGDYLNIPVTEGFIHESPFGVIEGREVYLKLVEANKEKFLDHSFEIRDEIYEADRACVRYLAIHGEEAYEVSEWYYIRDNKIDRIIANFNVGGAIDEERKLSDPK